LFNNREIAVAVWLLFLVMWLFSNKEIRSALSSVLDGFSKKVIIIPFSFLVFYTLVSVWLLSEVGMWDLSQVKNTVCGFSAWRQYLFFVLTR